MQTLYVVGAQQKPDALEKEGFQGYRRGLILRLDTEKRDADLVFEYESPADVVPEGEPSSLFTAATVENGNIYLCTSTEILTCDFPSFKQRSYLSLKSFHDIHHVRPTADGNLLVTNTGLDMVFLVTPEGEIIREWDVLGEPLWSRFNPEVDFRKVPSTKPHRAHPNFTFIVHNEIWVTRYHQMDAVCLDNPYKKIEINIEKPHDGIVCGDSVFFTTVNGFVVKADLNDLNKVTSYKIARSRKSLSWCRGLYIIDQRWAFVGFSRLRRTRWKDNVGWATGGINAIKDLATSPTSIVLYDMQSDKQIWNISLEDFGMNAVFSIHGGE